MMRFSQVCASGWGAYMGGWRGVCVLKGARRGARKISKSAPLLAKYRVCAVIGPNCWRLCILGQSTFLLLTLCCRRP